MDKMQALNAFWNSFDLIAYDENTVPDDAELPYITYESASDSFGNTIAQTTQLWYRSSSWLDITLKAQEISDRITRGGCMIPYDGGALWINRASPWAQRLSEESDNMVRRIVLNITIEFLD